MPRLNQQIVGQPVLAIHQTAVDGRKEQLSLYIPRRPTLSHRIRTAFMYRCQKLNDKEKTELLDYLKARMIPAAILLDCLQDNSTTYWLKMLYTPNTKKSGSDIWEVFSQKLLEQNGDLTLWRGIIEYFKKRGNIDGIDIYLIILFKHSMSEDEKKDFVSKMHEQILFRA